MATVTSLASHQTAKSYGANSLDYLSRFRMCVHPKFPSSTQSDLTPM
jgi:hypothetical protein